MANGIWLLYLGDVMRTEDSTVFGLTVGLSVEERATLLQDWGAGKEAFILGLKLRFGFYSVLPARLLGLSSLSIADAQAAAQDCLRLWDAGSAPGGGSPGGARGRRIRRRAARAAAAAAAAAAPGDAKSAPSGGDAIDVSSEEGRPSSKQQWSNSQHPLAVKLLAPGQLLRAMVEAVSQEIVTINRFRLQRVCPHLRHDRVLCFRSPSVAAAWPHPSHHSCAYRLDSDSPNSDFL
jgi:hypothetical protein